MPITKIVEVKIKIQKNYNYILNYWKEHYKHREENTGIYQWFCCSECDALYTLVICDGVIIKKFSDTFVCDDYYLSDWCEQDFQDILIPTQNELVLFELKYGFEFPFCGCAVEAESSPSAKRTTQEKNMEHPIMIAI